MGKDGIKKRLLVKEVIVKEDHPTVKEDDIVTSIHGTKVNSLNNVCSVLLCFCVMFYVVPVGVLKFCP